MAQNVTKAKQKFDLCNSTARAAPFIVRRCEALYFSNRCAVLTEAFRPRNQYKRLSCSFTQGRVFAKGRPLLNLIQKNPRLRPLFVAFQIGSG